jgi:hypothetical protein
MAGHGRMTSPASRYFINGQGRTASAAGSGLILHCEDCCGLALGLLDIESRLGLSKFFESPIGGFERIIEMTRLVVLVE